MSIFTRKFNFFNRVRETLINLANELDPDGLTPPNGSFYDDVSNSLGRVAGVLSPLGPASDGSFYETVPNNLERIVDNWPQGSGETQSLTVTSNGIYEPAGDYTYNYVDVNVSLDGYKQYVKRFNNKSSISFTEKEQNVLLASTPILTTLTATVFIGSSTREITVGSYGELADSMGWCYQSLLTLFFGTFSINSGSFSIVTDKIVPNSGTWELTTNVNDFWNDVYSWTFTFYLTPEQYAEITG